jgi:hypothetical protein
LISVNKVSDLNFDLFFFICIIKVNRSLNILQIFE